MRNWLLLALLGLVAIGLPVRASDSDLKKELESLKKEIEDLRKERSAARPVGTGVVDKMVDNKYGPDAVVKTKQGKLTIGGLLQVWYYNIENDNNGVFGLPDNNEMKDNDSYAIRRARLNFTMDIHENVQAYIQLAGENDFAGRPSFGSNVGYQKLTSTAAYTDASVTSDQSQDVGLLDAYIKVHGLIPHHDSMIGQFIPKVGMEGPQNSGTLDFVERSMIGQLSNGYDVGSQLHGTWMDDRIQYWLGVFNTPNGFLNANNANRADTNDLKSFLLTAQFRPVWKNETWGSLEIGGSAQFNVEGGDGTTTGDGAAVGHLDDDGEEFDDIRYYGWVSYAPGGPVKGWWLKGEYAYIRGVACSAYADNDVNTVAEQLDPHAFDTYGWYFSTGYKLSDSIWADDLPAWLKPAEFCFRYETYGNIQVADQVNPDTRHDVYKTSIYTAGLNYYIKGHNAKIQVNYNWVKEPSEHMHPVGGGDRPIRDLHNDNLVVNFQVMW